MQSRQVSMKRSKPAPIDTENDGEPTGIMIGYARVSTQDQDPQMQIEMLRKAGCDPAHIHVENVSAAAKSRPMLERAMKDARRGDTFIVYRLDRLARNLLDLIMKLRGFEQRGIKFRSLTEQIDTSTVAGRFMMYMIGAVAEMERDLTRERTKHGIAERKAKGIPHGAAPTFDREKAREWFRKGLGPSEVAAKVGVTRSRIYQLFDADERERLRRQGLKRKR